MSDQAKIEWLGYRHKVIELKGEKYYLNVSLGYYQTKQYKKLHREIWKSKYGAVPEDCLVHHKDGDKTNNEIDNLEVMEWGKHTRHHHKTGKTMATLPCAFCGKSVTREKTAFRRTKNPFCNRTCHMLHRNRVLQINPFKNAVA